jgi:hypothetical protein
MRRLLVGPQCFSRMATAPRRDDNGSNDLVLLPRRHQRLAALTAWRRPRRACTFRVRPPPSWLPQLDDLVLLPRRRSMSSMDLGAAVAAWIPDALIVGAGPSGLAAAACLTARGVPTTELEMSASRSTSPAAFVSCRCSRSRRTTRRCADHQRWARIWARELRFGLSFFFILMK